MTTHRARWDAYKIKSQTPAAYKKLWNAWKKNGLSSSVLHTLKTEYSSVYFFDDLEFNRDALLELINVYNKRIKFCTSLGWLASMHGVGPHVDSSSVEYSHLCILNPKDGFGVVTIDKSLKLPFRHSYDHPCAPNYNQKPGDIISIRTDKLHWLEAGVMRGRTVNNKIWGALTFSTNAPMKPEHLKCIFANVITKLQDKYIHKL